MTSEKWHVLMVDEQPIVQNGVAGLLEKEEYDLVLAKNCEEGSLALQEKKYSLLIIDIYRGDSGCLQMIESIIEKYPGLNIILFTTIVQEDLLRSLYAGGCSIVLKSENGRYLFEGIKAALNGLKYLSPSVQHLKKSMPKATFLARPLHFTKQEERILALSAIGLSSKEIAVTFDLTKSTVDTYKRRLIKKFKMNNINELIAYAQSINKL